MSTQTVETPTSRWAATKVFYFCRWRTPVLALLAVSLTVGPLVLLAWYIALDPNWIPQAPDFSRTRRGAAAALGFWGFLALFMKLPIWIRLPFLLGAGLQIVRLAIRRTFHAFDQKPDFSIGPEGIGGIDATGFQLIPWADIHSVTARGPHIVIEGQEHGPKRFFGKLPPRRIRIAFSELLFKIPETEVTDAIRFFRPDISIKVIDVNYGRF